MEEFIKTDEGVFIVKHHGKDFKIEMFEEKFNILVVEYSSNSFVLGDENKIINLFNEFEPLIIEIMKSIINDNIEFYKHFDIDFTLVSDRDYYNITPIDSINNKFHKIQDYNKFLKLKLKSESLDYINCLTDDNVRLAYGHL